MSYNPSALLSLQASLSSLSAENHDVKKDNRLSLSSPTMPQKPSTSNIAHYKPISPPPSSNHNSKSPQESPSNNKSNSKSKKIQDSPNNGNKGYTHGNLRASAPAYNPTGDKYTDAAHRKVEKQELKAEDFQPLSPPPSSDLSLHYTGGLEGPHLEGWLQKKGSNNPIWKKRFFVLKNNELSYYPDANRERMPLGKIKLHESMLVRASPPLSHYHQAFGLWRPDCYFQIDLPVRTFYFFASSKKEMETWVSILIRSKKFYEEKQKFMIESKSQGSSGQMSNGSLTSISSASSASSASSISSNNSTHSSVSTSSFQSASSSVHPPDIHKLSMLRRSASSALTQFVDSPYKFGISKSKSFDLPTVGHYIESSDVDAINSESPQYGAFPDQSCEIEQEQICLRERVGEGAFGAVYRVFLWEKEVAVKLMKDQPSSPSGIDSDLESEVNILKSLRHPNCVLFIGYCKPPKFCIVTEYMAHGSLADLLYNFNCRLTFNQILKITFEVALAMNYLHQHNPPILHRDLKSSNILVDEHWTAKVSDFGLARVRGALKLPAFCGSVQWRAPEVSESFFHPAGDVYSYGVFFWEMITRKEPFKGRDYHNIRESVKKGERPPIPESCMDSFAQLIRQCWDQDHTARPSFKLIIEYLKTLVDTDLTTTMSVAQLRSSTEVYAIEDLEHVKKKFDKRTSQGFYNMLAPGVLYCRIWSLMVTKGREMLAISNMKENLFPVTQPLCKSFFVLKNKHGKVMCLVSYDSSEKVRSVDQAVLRQEAEPMKTRFLKNLKESTNLPVVRESVEMVEYQASENAFSQTLACAQIVSASVDAALGVPEKLFDAFNTRIPSAYPGVAGWMGSFLITDPSVASFVLINFFDTKQHMKEMEKGTSLQDFLGLYSKLFSSTPNIDHYDIVFQYINSTADNGVGNAIDFDKIEQAFHFL